MCLLPPSLQGLETQNAEERQGFEEYTVQGTLAPLESQALKEIAMGFSPAEAKGDEKREDCKRQDACRSFTIR